MKKRTPNLKQMASSLQKYLSYIEDSVAQIQFPSSPKNLYAPMEYILKLGGKRMRPVLTLMACEAFSSDFQKAKNAALAVELFHNFSLIHDDIMDKAPLRRGESTVHIKWNENVGILSGDAMLVEAYKLLLSYDAAKSNTLMKLFSITATEVCEGQQFDMDFESGSTVTIPEYLNMIRLKTAVLLGCSLKMGAVIGDASDEDCQKIYDFGVNLGIAFQLQDDILDLYAEQAKFGKQVGGDILANKKTYLILKAFEDADSTQSTALNKMLAENDSAKKIKQAQDIFQTLSIKEKATEKMNAYYDIAITSINELQLTSENKKSFYELAHFLMNREN